MSSAPSSTELSPLKRAFLALEQAQQKLAAAERAAREPIAIIGIGCRVPGADDPAAFWQLLRDGVDAIGPVPPNRFDLDAVYAADGQAPGTSTTREGGFLRAVDGFDAGLFGISRREANGMDPQQRLLLEVSWEALEHAGQPPDRLERSATGVYFGVCSNDYANLQLQAGDPSLLDAHYTSGLAHSVASGRVSYVLGLQGPSITVDTACSSSLVAVHLACQALRAGDCRMALAGGVNLMLSPDLFVAFSQTRMLAPDGRCKTFDAAADGFARGEGCGVVVLKRLSDAQADGDRVLAVIRGSAVNQDGPSSGLTAPNGPAQEAVIREALARADVAPHAVGYVEAHGTGTSLGDPLEVQALGKVFGDGRAPATPLWIGSVKTNLGHLEAAAGVTGLIKLVLSLRQRAIAPHLHFKTPSPHIAWSELPVRVPTALQPWEPIDGRRIGAVSSFGFSGTNAHVIVEEALSPLADGAAPKAAAHAAARLFVLSARDRATLALHAGRVARALAGRSDAQLADACFTAATSRAQHAHRAAIVADTMDELRAALEALSAGAAVAGTAATGSQPAPAVGKRSVGLLRTAHLQRRDPARIAFLFTGQGSQYAGMACELHASEPAFRRAFDRCAEVLDPLLERPLRDVVFAADAQALLDRTAYTQPALFALEYALAQMWRAWGVVPDIVIGHSVGELVAACVAGAMPLDDALRLVAERGALMQSLPDGGAMAAIAASEAEVAAALAGHAERVAIAAVNAAEQTVISGTAAAVHQTCERFTARGIRCQPLAVSHAFHSPLVEPIVDRFEAAAAQVRWSRPRLRLISNLSGGVADADALVQPRYWRDHVRQPVRFADGARTLAALEPDVCIEIGPHPTLIAMAQEAFGERAPVLVPSLRRGQADAAQITDALSALHLAGVALDWRAVWSSARARLIDLPTYPFQRERCWFQAKATTPPAAAGRASGHPLLGVRLRSPLHDVVQFEQTLCTDELPWLRDHRVQGRTILPATAYLEIALSAARQLVGAATLVQDLAIAEPLVVEPDQPRLIQVIVRTGATGDATVEVLSSSTDAADDNWRSHAQGRLPRPHDTVAAAVPSDTRTAIEHRCTEEIDGAAHYARLAAHGLAFGPALHGVRALRRRDGEALADIELPEAAGVGPWCLHPALLDACLQCIAWAVPAQMAAGRAFLPLAIELYRWHRAPAGPVWAHVDLTPGSGAAGLRADLRVHDADGPVAELLGIALRPAASPTHDPASPFYEIAWQPERVSPAWPAPVALAETLAGRLSELARDNGLDDAYRAGSAALDAHVVDHVARALQALGWSPTSGDRVDTASLAAQLAIAPKHRRTLHRLLAMLAQDGRLHECDGAWRVQRWPTPPTVDDLSARAASLRAQHPSSAIRLAFVARCGEALAAILRGEADPLHCLFPEGAAGDAEALYAQAPEARVYNAFARDAVLAALERRPASERLRVLEVGGGTGGTTVWLAPALPAQGTDYLFTDIGASLVANARERFAAHRFMRFQAFDIEQDAVPQAVEPGFDLIVASNVVHATADLRRTLRRLRALLAPGGMLLLLEATASERWIDLTFGLTDGWWRFSDADLRSESPLLGREAWLAVLNQCGFEAAPLHAPHPASQQVVLAARRPLRGAPPLAGEPSTAPPVAAPTASHAVTWLVFGDALGVGDVLAQRLRAAGHAVVVLRRMPSATAAPDDLLVTGERIDWPALMRPLVAGAAAVVHLWALDEPAQADADAPATSQQRLFEPLLALVQALAGGSFAVGRMPALWVATRGAQAVDQRDTVTGLTCASTWGLGRVIALEHPELRPTWIDLDPTTPAAAQADLLLELITEGLDGDRESQLALRADTRFVARLQRARLDESEPQARPLHLVAAGSGVLDDLALQPVARVAPGPGEVEIRVLASGLNFRDVMNAVEMRADPEPLGGECAGCVTAVGDGVTGLAIGDAVVALGEDAFATYVCCDARQVERLAPTLSYADAASVPFAFMTAHHALIDLGGLDARHSVLIHAAAGGVGSAAVQLAQRCGATVIATAGSEAKRAHLRAAGVRHVLDSRSLDFASQVLALTSGRGVDLVLNSLAGAFIEASVRCLAADGTFLEIGKREIWDAERFHRVRPQGRYHAIDLAAMRHADVERWRALFRQAMREAARGAIEPLPLQAFGLSRAIDAFRWMAQARHIGKVVLTQWDDAHAADEPLAAHASYLVTGGLSGLGLATAEHLAARGARYLALVGRRAPSTECNGRLQALRERGVQVLVLQEDIGDAAAVDRIFAAIDAKLPPLRGVLHAAGVLADAAIAQQSWSRVAEVMAPKVDGSWALHRHTRHRPLDFFVMYSSVAAVFGSAGQANHAAANAFIDALAAHRRALGLPALSVAWGAWSETGSAAGLDVGARTAGQGLQPIATAQGLAMLDRLMRGAPAHVAACPVDWQQLLSHHAGSRTPAFLLGMQSELAAATHAQRQRLEAAGPMDGAPSIQPIDALRRAPQQRRRDLLLSLVAQQVARVLGAADGNAIDPQQPLSELGLDSLMAVELRNRLGTALALARSLPATLAFDHPTLDALTLYLEPLLFPPAADVATTPAAAREHAAPHDMVQAIDDLSDEQIEELFARRTGRT